MWSCDYGVVGCICMVKERLVWFWDNLCLLLFELLWFVVVVEDWVLFDELGELFLIFDVVFFCELG